MPGPLLLAGPPVVDLDDHVRRGGGDGIEIARRYGPVETVEELEASGLRGRGGAGFPTGLKWRSILDGGEAAGDRFAVANGAEGEPGTFKDRTLLRHDPYAVLEGLLIAARTVGARRAFVALKASFVAELDRVRRAIAEMAAAGWLRDVSIEVVEGPDEYLFGEEKGLLQVIQGEDPLPGIFPPYVHGLFSTAPQVGWSAGEDRSSTGPTVPSSNPTLVNNVETLANVPVILREGAAAFRRFGTLESPGTVICTVGGDTVRHGVGEYALGTPLEQVIVELGGGLPDGRAVRYVVSGVANPVIRGEDVTVPVSYEGLESVGSGLGAAGFMVYDDRTDPVELAAAVSRFLGVESCGQCPACKLGTAAITDDLERLADEGGDARRIAVIDARLVGVTDASRCYLPTQEQRVVGSLLPDMRDPQARRGTSHRGLLVTKLVDLVGDRFLVDLAQARKRPDWTYEPE
ncbi:MAG: NADH-ubiquinone oxidoreductase-F iron-sulfur binding region domain-containing protein [Actinomycetota bacterium]